MQIGKKDSAVQGNSDSGTGTKVSSVGRGLVRKLTRRKSKAARRRGKADGANKNAYQRKDFLDQIDDDPTVSMISDEELAPAEIAYVGGGLASGDPGRRERIATAVLAALVGVQGQCKRSMIRSAVAAADELAAQLDATAKGQ